MKKLALCFIAFLGIFGSSAFADDRLYRFSERDMDMIFHRDSTPLELAMLSHHEMQTTEGEWWPLAVAGAIGSGIANIGYQLIVQKSWSWDSFGWSLVKGATFGYVRGGCTAIGMKKKFPTVIDESAKKLGQIYVSGGKIGMQLCLKPEDLRMVSDAKYADITFHS